MTIDTHSKEILGLITCILGIIAYIPYLSDIYKGKTHPHTFSWLVWTLVVGTGYFGQVSDGGGAGAWGTGTGTGTGATLCLIVFICSLKSGEKDITLLDWVCLISCLIGIYIWWITDTPLWTMIIVSLVDTLAYVPTFRKAYLKPFSETLSLYCLSEVKILLGIIALENFSFITLIFPATMLTTNLFFITMVINRRKVTPNLHIQPHAYQL